ncbi:uncharacterized protein EbC_pEb10200030 (plasmid) [Erwinia billingiae Eb661]|uniref:Uncharacterized protein n=1 Tax=Erwinia billingiae (strain Eb661) TaxID=634500 RepID=D8MJ93_ERWBE|nr:uncharacterized protein EbC_pEb10200030 [Erwinia billingiae Eb661]
MQRNKTGIRLPALPFPVIFARALTLRAPRGHSANYSSPAGAGAALLLRNRYRYKTGFVTQPFSDRRFIPVAPAPVRGQNRRQKEDLRILKSGGVYPCESERIRPARGCITHVLHLKHGACGH